MEEEPQTTKETHKENHTCNTVSCFVDRILLKGYDAYGQSSNDYSSNRNGRPENIWAIYLTSHSR
jgi:hypothetical protein